jgi:hypothetical protein
VACTPPRGGGILHVGMTPKRLAEHEPSPHHLYDGSDCSDADFLKRHSSKARLTPPASAPSASQGADTSVASNL